MRVALEPHWRGSSLDRLLDFDHSRLAQSVKRWLERGKWLVEVEVTFSPNGERGSIDLLAFHPASGVLLVIEIKTVLPDLQAMLRSLDAKVRLAHREADRFGWKPTSVVPCLVMMETSTNRRRIADFAGVLTRFVLHGRAARRWLRSPVPLAGGGGLLVLWKLPATPGGSARRAGRERVSRSTTVSSVETLREPPFEVPIRAEHSRRA